MINQFLFWISQKRKQVTKGVKVKLISLVFDTNTVSEIQNLSDTIRIIFLSCPPVNEAKIRENKRYMMYIYYGLCIICLFYIVM